MLMIKYDATVIDFSNSISCKKTYNFGAHLDNKTVKFTNRERP